MKILVVGGAGYIGSHMVKYLLDERHQVTVLDDLSAGYRDAVLPGADFVRADIGDRSALHRLFAGESFDAVMHFASWIQVGESVRDPSKYYRNNVTNTLTLLDALVANGIQYFVFSSTAAIFGEPEYTPIDEAHPKRPVSPYGWSKLMVEQILADYGAAYGLKSTCLRYFNAAGADPEGQLGERHVPETHLIPLVMQTASRRRDSIAVYGSDYGTEDGTCVRDYVHVTDLAQAHLLALERMRETGESAAYNLGNGAGFSVREVIEAARVVTGQGIPVVDRERRPGDPAVLVADSTKAARELGWKPRFSELEVIIEHAWRWERRMAASEDNGH